MTVLRLLLASLALMLFPSAALAEAARPFAVADQTITPRTRADFRIIVPEGSDGATFIPVTVIHGRKAGKVLAMVAGVHGFYGITGPPVEAGDAVVTIALPTAGF
jgi:uncharacterized protein